MNTLDSIKIQLSELSFLSIEQSVSIKGGEDKRDPRTGSALIIPPKTSVKPR